MISFKKLLPGIAWFFLLLILICLPGDDLPKGNNWMNAVYFDKWVHTGLFSVLAFLFMWPVINSLMPPEKIFSLMLIISVGVSIWGLTTEYIQKYFVPGRNFDLWDWAADSLGAFLALIVCRKIFRARIEHKKNPN